MFELKDADIRSLRWSPWNVQHIARPGHDATPAEVEEVAHSPRSLAQAGKYGRLLIIGPTHAGRMLVAVLDPELNGVWYCVSARTANTKKDLPRYWEEYKRRHPDE